VVNMLHINFMFPFCIKMNQICQSVLSPEISLTGKNMTTQVHQNILIVNMNNNQEENNTQISSYNNRILKCIRIELLSSSAEAVNTWIYTSTSPCLHRVVLNDAQGQHSFTLRLIYKNTERSFKITHLYLYQKMCFWCS
jgi:hypothetical protein